MKKLRRNQPNQASGKGKVYRQLWRLVDGAVKDAMMHHPDYFTDKGNRGARISINKRVVGALHGCVQNGTRGRAVA